MAQRWVRVKVRDTNRFRDRAYFCSGSHIAWLIARLLHFPYISLLWSKKAVDGDIKMG